MKELIQEELIVDNITTELNKILFDVTKQAQIQKDYNDLKLLLSKGGNASANAANSVYKYLLTT